MAEYKQNAPDSFGHCWVFSWNQGLMTWPHSRVGLALTSQRHAEGCNDIIAGRLKMPGKRAPSYNTPSPSTLADCVPPPMQALRGFGSYPFQCVAASLGPLGFSDPHKGLMSDPICLSCSIQNTSLRLLPTP